MSSRRWLLAVVFLSAVFHIVGMARTPLPAQDGLKFLRIAREFQTQPWVDVIRSSDQHPLYPALVALFEPVTSAIIGHGPDAWRITAQAVSMIAALLMLWPLQALTRRLFDERAGNLAIFLYVILPFPAMIGHDTLSDSLALSLTVASLCLGESALRSKSWWSAVGCGVTAGLGFLTRPEVALVPPMVVVAGMLRWRTWVEEFAIAARLAAVSVSVLIFVGSYAIVKGDLSEKLSLRWSTSIGLGSRPPKKLAPQFPRGLNNPRFDFSPKEESGEASLKNNPMASVERLGQEWAGGISSIFIPCLLWGLYRGRKFGGSVEGRRLLLVYFGSFALVAIRHATTLGYLSGRHALSLIVVSIPWVAAGTVAWVEDFPARRGLSLNQGRRLGYLGLILLGVVGFSSQLKAGHTSRWGYRAAGIWLAHQAGPGDAVLDTRGWASFVRGVPGYDYWHVRQALSDKKLAYVVVGSDELKASSRRASTLRAMLAYAGKPVAEFPVRKDGQGSRVMVYKFDPPESWEGIRP